MITIIIYNIKHLTRWSAVGILWFVLFTIPGGVWSIFVLQDNIFYEHRMYLPLMGVAIFFQSTSPHSYLEKWGLYIIGIALIFISFTNNYVRLDYYVDEDRFANQCVIESPTCTKSFIIRGETRISSEQFDEGIRDFKLALHNNPNSYRIYNRMGNVYEMAGKADSAIISYHNAIGIDPTFAEGYYNIGNVFLNMKDINLAILNYSKSIGLDSTFIPSYHNRAVAYYQLYEYELAWNDLQFVERRGFEMDRNFYSEIKIRAGK